VEYAFQCLFYTTISDIENVTVFCIYFHWNNTFEILIKTAILNNNMKLGVECMPGIQAIGEVEAGGL
jgi:hypothetical protein